MSTTIRARRWLIAGGLAAALAATAAWVAAGTSATPASAPPTTGGSSMATMMSGTGTMAATGTGMNGGVMGRFTAGQPFDVQFLDQMIAHHEMALVSTRTMITNSKDARLRKLAADIETSQSRQATQMRSWRQAWYPNTPATFAGGMDPAAMAPQMMTSMMGGDPAGRMRSMLGDAGVDRMYLQMMIVHHQLAVDMAQQAIKQATHPQLRDLARTIADEQSAQITQMRGYLGSD
ncbi:MAG: DUF305 domain-containing protein [Nocardioidaceae bacterium]